MPGLENLGFQTLSSNKNNKDSASLDKICWRSHVTTLYHLHILSITTRFPQLQKKAIHFLFTVQTSIKYYKWPNQHSLCDILISEC